MFQSGVSRALGQVVSGDGERRQRESGERSRTAFTLVTDPDLTVLRTADGALRVRVDGLDAYNPQSGQVEPADARRVSCMMVDTDFDGESFFARRVNFPNITRGYAEMIERLRAAFSREIDVEKRAMMKRAPRPCRSTAPKAG